MDIVHHAVIGGIGFSFLAGNNQEIAGIAFCAATVFPDLDVFFMLFGKRFYLKKHQGPTHSLILSPLFALLLSFPLIYSIGFNATIILAALAGLWIHTFLDLTNTFGISLLWPLSDKRYSFDIIFFIDLSAWIITLCFYIFFYVFKSVIVFYAYISIFALYFLFKYLLHQFVKSRLQCKLAIPSSDNPFEFFILEKKDSSIKTYRYNLVNKQTRDTELFDPPPKRYEEMAKKSRIFNDLKEITKFLRITDISENEQGTKIIARDLGIRNFGGKFGTTTLHFNRNEELIDEMANI